MTDDGKIIPGGFFIAFEGGENAGKTTQAQAIGRWLGYDLGYQVMITRAPGGTRIGQQIREVLLDRANTDMDPGTEALLYAADRCQHVNQVIVPALNEGKIVVTDRYTDSAIAYQGAGRRLGHVAIRDLNEWASGGLDPDLTVLLDIDPAHARAHRTVEPNRIEDEPPEFHERVRKAFLGLTHNDPRRYLIVDAAQPVEHVTASVQDRIVQELKRRRSSVYPRNPSTFLPVRSVISRKTYTVGRSWSTDLEPGTWYEICPVGRDLIAGFVFVPPYKPAGGVDVHTVWDYREVDGRRIPRQGSTLKGLDRKRYADMIDGFTAAVEACVATNSRLAINPVFLHRKSAGTQEDATMRNVQVSDGVIYNGELPEGWDRKGRVIHVEPDASGDQVVTVEFEPGRTQDIPASELEPDPLSDPLGLDDEDQ